MAATGTKRKCIVLDIPTKLGILDLLENGGKAVDIATEFGVGKSTVSDIKVAKNKLREFMVNSDTKNISRHTMKPRADEIWIKPYRPFLYKRTEVHFISSGPILKEKALWLDKQLHPEDHSFTASEGWLNRWKIRHGIRQLAIQGELLFSSGHDTESFKQALAELRVEKEIGPEQL